ncbi:Bro-N domain-containing protein [Candidatus Saccharibacteria bacterium]|nr:Bro-N domain-containing protein [Candidatus Saccharibacteria bacterium]MCL1963003.1 Bro-N domain-containing protein [Candidatus Saccharibacteria bacterium]
MTNKVRLFQKQQVRSIWDEENEKWWFSVVDIVRVLTDSDYQSARKYWKVLKGRLVKEGANQLVTNCYQLKMRAEDGKKRLTDVMDTEQILRLVQSIPSKKAEPFKLWLAEVSATEISIDEQPATLTESAKIAKTGASVAKNARVDLEKKLGRGLISSKNAEELGNRKRKLIKGEKDER